ncbi:MAG: hypothetical protein ACP5KP_02440 [Candidatus Micrarchaeia archaeon]
MFLFQARKETKEVVEEPLLQELKNKGVALSDEGNNLLTKFVRQEGKKWKERKIMEFYFKKESTAKNFISAMAELETFIMKNYGVKITCTYNGWTKDGYLVRMEKIQVAPEKIPPTGAVVPTKAPPPTTKAEPTIPPTAAPRGYALGYVKEKVQTITPTATMSDVEKRVQELKEKGYLGVEILDSEGEAKKKLEQFPTDSEKVFEHYTIETGVDDTLQSERIEVFASSTSYTKFLEVVPDLVHSYGYQFSDAGSYPVTPLNLRNYAGNVGGLVACMYAGHADFMKENKKTAEKKAPLDLAAYLNRGWTGVLKFTDDTGERKLNESKTINMHKTRIEALFGAYKTFDKIRGVIPDDLWVSLRVFSLAQADHAISLGVIDENRKKEYADAFAFGMLALMWYESGLTHDELLPWLREEIRGTIDPDKVINNIMAERDEYRLFYGDQEITSPTEIVYSPYKDLMITDKDGKTPLAHLRISHPKWLDNRRAWEATKAANVKKGVLHISIEKWSWLGIGVTAYYHPLKTELWFRLKEGGVEDKYIIGYKPQPPEERPKEVVDAFSVVGDTEFRLVGTQFKTEGTIMAYGDKSINDLKQDENFSLDYIGIAVPKERKNIAYLVLPQGEDLKDRLPGGIKNYDEGMQNAILVYEDHRYDLILTINNKEKNILPGVSKSLIDKGLKPTDLLFEINRDGTLDIYVYLDEKGKIVKDPDKYKGLKYVEVLASGVKLSDADIEAIRTKGISGFASFEDNGRTGLDLYSVVKINEDGTITLVDAARIAGHEFDDKFLYEKGYRREYLGSLPSSRVVKTATGEKSYHILPTDIPEQYRDLVVGTIPRELITASRDGKSGEFTATLDEHVAVQKGIEKYVVSYYMNYTGKPPLSFEFAGLPVSVETLTSKNKEERKAAINQLLAISQNPISLDEAPNYLGMISEAEAKWKDRLDDEDRKNLAVARANFEQYSKVAKAGEMAAAPSVRIPTTIEAPTPPYVGEEEMRPAPEAVIPRDWIKTVPPDQLDKWMPRFEGAYMDMWAAFAKSIENPNDPSVKNYTQSFMRNMSLPSSTEYASLSPQEKVKVQYLLFGVSGIDDDVVKDFLKAFETGDIDRIREMAQTYAQSPMRTLLENLSKFKVMIPQALVVTGVGSTIFRFESEGYKGGKYGAPQKGLAFDLSAFVDFIYEGWRAKYITLNFETGEANFANDYIKRYGLEPKVKATIEQRLAGGEELYAEGTYGIRLIFDDLGRLATGKPKTSYGVGKFAAGIENVRIGNVTVGIEGDWERFPVFEGTADRYSLEGKADFLLLSIPWEVKAGGRTTINGKEAEKTAFAVVAAKLVETEGGYSIEPFVGVEYKGINDYLQRGGGVMLGSPFGQTKLGIWQRKDGKLVFDFGIGVEF